MVKQLEDPTGLANGYVRRPDESLRVVITHRESEPRLAPGWYAIAFASGLLVGLIVGLFPVI